MFNSLIVHEAFINVFMNGLCRWYNDEHDRNDTDHHRLSRAANGGAITETSSRSRHAIRANTKIAEYRIFVGIDSEGESQIVRYRQDDSDDGDNRQRGGCRIMSETTDTQAVREQLAGQLDTGFLKDKRYKDLGKPLAEIVTDFKEFVIDDLLKERPDLVESGDIGSIQATAERAYSAACRQRIAGQASPVKLIVLGASWPFDYVGNWISKRRDLYMDAVKKRDLGNSGPLNVLLGLAPNSTGQTVALVNAQGVPVEHRDAKGDDKGKPFKVEHSYLCNIPAIVQELTGKKRTLLVTLGLGGEGGDSLVNVKCTKCGFVSYHKVCPNLIETKVPNTNPPQIVKVPCKHVKPFYEYEDICKNGFVGIKTNMKITQTEEGADVVQWVDQTSALGEKVPVSRDDVRALLKTVLKNKLVVGKDLAKFWDDNKNNRGTWIAYIGTVSSVSRTPDKTRQKRRRVDLDDPSLAFVTSGKAVQGVPAYIPEYVWDCMEGDRITSYSQLLVIAEVQRREKSVLVNGQWQQQPGQYRDPELSVWGFFLLDGGQERKIKQDVIEGGFVAQANTFATSDLSAAMDMSGATGGDPTTVVEQVVQSSEPVTEDRPIEQPATPKPAGAEDDWL